MAAFLRRRDILKIFPEFSVFLEVDQDRFQSASIIEKILDAFNESTPSNAGRMCRPAHTNRHFHCTGTYCAILVFAARPARRSDFRREELAPVN